MKPWKMASQPVCAGGSEAHLRRTPDNSMRTHVLQSQALQCWVSDLQRMKLAGDRKRALLIDTGANQGDFSKEAMRLLSSLRLTAMVHPILLEPQPQFGPQLQDLAARWNGTYVPAAAWKGRANLTFYKSRNAETTSIRRTMAACYRNTGQSRMPTVDMAYFCTRLPRVTSQSCSRSMSR